MATTLTAQTIEHANEVYGIDADELQASTATIVFATDRDREERS